MKKHDHPLLFEIKRSLVECLEKNRELLQSADLEEVVDEMRAIVNDRDPRVLESLLEDVTSQEGTKPADGAPEEDERSRKRGGQTPGSIFLGSVGEHLVDTLRNFAIDIDPVRLFISYSTRDKTRVRPYQALFEESPYVADAFIDSFDINPGVLYKEAIHNALTNVDAIVVFLTEDSARSDWVQREIATGRKNNIPTIPVIMDKSILTSLDAKEKNANKHEREEKGKLVDLLNTNGVRGFSLLPCEIVHKTICAVNSNKFMGRIGNEKLEAQIREREKYFSSILESIQADYNRQDGDHRWAIKTAEELLLTNENEDDRSTCLLELLINLYLLDKANSGDIDDGFSRNAFENIKKLLYRLLNKSSKFGAMTENTELEPVEYQNLPLMFKLALVLIMQEKYYEAFSICLRLCNSPRFSDDMRLSSQIEAVTLGVADVISKLTDRTELEEYITDKEKEFGKTKEESSNVEVEAEPGALDNVEGIAPADLDGSGAEAGNDNKLQAGFMDDGRERFIITHEGGKTLKIPIRVEDINEHFVKASYIDWGIVHNVLNYIRQYFNTFGQKADRAPWTYVNFGYRRVHPDIREHFVGSPPPLTSAQEAQLELRVIKKKIENDNRPADYYQTLEPKLYHAVCFNFLFVKYFKETLGFRSRKWSNLDEEYMRGLVGECESFIQEDMKLGAESFHHDLLSHIARNGDTNPFGNDYFIHWVELSSARRIERIIQNKVFQTMGSLFTDGYFDEIDKGDDIIHDEMVLYKKLERMVGAEKLKEIPLSEDISLRCFQEEVLYFTRSLIIHIEHKINITVPGFGDGNYETFMEAVEEFWREKIVSVVHLHHFMVEHDGKGESNGESNGDSSKRFETLSRKEQLCYQIMFAILETFRSFRNAEFEPGAIVRRVQKKLPGWNTLRHERSDQVQTLPPGPRTSPRGGNGSPKTKPNGKTKEGRVL